MDISKGRSINNKCGAAAPHPTPGTQSNQRWVLLCQQSTSRQSPTSPSPI